VLPPLVPPMLGLRRGLGLLGVGAGGRSWWGCGLSSLLFRLLLLPVARRKGGGREGIVFEAGTGLLFHLRARAAAAFSGSKFGRC
jgi:hypothetical protein